MINARLASAYVDITINVNQFNSGLGAVVARLNQLRGLGTINLTATNTGAMSSIGTLQRQVNALRASGTINLTSGRGGGFGGGGMAGSAGMGLLQGLGAAQFAMNPAMMAGQMIGSGLRDAVGSAIALESTFTDLQRVSGQSAENVGTFRDTLFAISKSQAGVSFADLTEIASTGAKAGISDKEGMGGLETFTRGMAKGRNAVSGIGTEQLANDMVRMLNLFGMGTDYVESFGSVLARMDNISTSAASDILDISKSLSGTFASLNLTIPQVMAFSSVIADVGLTNQQGASSFSQILRMMASQSEKMAEAIGMPVEKFQEAIRTNALGALKLLIDRFKEINESDPIKAQEWVSELGFRGVKTAGAFQQLASMIDSVAERTAMAVEEEETLGALTAANEMKSQTTLANIQLVKNAFAELATEVGDKLIPYLKDAAVSALALYKAWSGGKAGGPEGPTAAERGERMNLMTKDPFRQDAAAQARIAEINRKEEEQIAYQNDQKLSADAPAVAERLKSLQATLRDAAPEARPAIEAAISRIQESKAVAAAQGGMALPDVAARGDVAALVDEASGGLADAMAMKGRATLTALFGGPDFTDAKGKPLEGARLESARKKDVKSLIDEAKNDLFGAALYGTSPEGQPLTKGLSFKELQAQQKREATEARREEQGLRSERFGDPAEYASSAIQAALSGSQELGLAEQRKMNETLVKIHTVLDTRPGAAGTRRLIMER